MPLNLDFTDPEVIGNYLESGFWLAIAVILGIRGRWSQPPYRSLSAWSAVTFFFFGLSDLVEAQTGAWWRPLWLFVWKATCVVALALCYLKYRQIKKREKKVELESEKPGTADKTSLLQDRAAPGSKDQGGSFDA